MYKIKTVLAFLISMLVLGINNSCAQWSWVYPTITGNNLNKIQFIDNNIGFIVGDNGTLLKTANEGINWITLNTGIKNGLTNLKFLYSETGYISGTN